MAFIFLAVFVFALFGCSSDNEPDKNIIPDASSSSQDQGQSQGSDNSSGSAVLIPIPLKTFKETVGGASFDMIAVQGGTYQRGRSEGDKTTSEGETPAHKVTLSDYFVGKYEVTNAQWTAVMGGSACSWPADCGNQPKTTINWYDAVEFTCKMSSKTGKKYRLLTDAEFEYAARGGKESKGYLYSGSNTASEVAVAGVASVASVGSKNANELGIYDMSGNVYEWVYDSWQSDYDSGDKVNPTGPVLMHTQKTRRGGSYDQPASESRVSARKIRSIEGADGSIGLRLAVSASGGFPAGMTDPCDIHQPVAVENEKGFRDKNLITADGEVWVNDGYGVKYILFVKANGTAMYSMIINNNAFQPTSGEWYTLNNFSLNIVSGTTTKKYIYYLIDKNNMSMMPAGDMPGRWVRKTVAEAGVSSINVPAVANPKPLEQLRPANYAIDMSNPPATNQDSRLIDGTSDAWLQDNVELGAGGTHRYRFDFDSKDKAQFVVYDADAGTSVGLARGSWFTVDDNFLRITYNNKNYDYLYTVTDDGKTYYHISYQGYERGDFRMFKKVKATDVPNWSEPTGFYYESEPNGSSTYAPPK